MREAYNMFKDGGDPEKVKTDAFVVLTCQTIEHICKHTTVSTVYSSVLRPYLEFHCLPNIKWLHARTYKHG